MEEGRKYGLYDSMEHWIGRLNSAMTDRFTRSLKQYGVTPSQWSVLVTIEQGRATSPARLAKYVGVDGAAITRLLDRLEKKGLILRKREGFDRRAINVELTEKAKGLMPQLQEIAKKNIDVFLEGLTDKEEVVLKAMINKMLRNAGIMNVIY